MGDGWLGLACHMCCRTKLPYEYVPRGSLGHRSVRAGEVKARSIGDVRVVLCVARSKLSAYRWARRLAVPEMSAE